MLIPAWTSYTPTLTTQNSRRLIHRVNFGPDFRIIKAKSKSSKVLTYDLPYYGWGVILAEIISHQEPPVIAVVSQNQI